jgi:hypothetical protein
MTKIPIEHCGKRFKDLKHCFIDFEYNGTTEKFLNLVAVSMWSPDDEYRETVWLHKDQTAKNEVADKILAMRETHFFVAFNAVAEAESFIALGLDPSKHAWIDLQIEYKMLTNHWHKFTYGKHLIDGKEVFTSPPKSKWEQTEEERLKANNAKPKHNLSGCTYKMLGVKIDTDRKDQIRNLIISSPGTFTKAESAEILEYCESDIEYLPRIKDAIFESYRRSNAAGNIFLAEVALRGKTAARTALMSKTGYPVNRVSVTNFSKSTISILNDLAEDINSQFHGTNLFVWNKSRGQYSKKEGPQREWIDASEYKDRWRKTETGSHSLSLDAYADHFSYSHDYPRGNFPAQILRYLKTNQSLNGFRPNSKNSFFDYYGSDDRARAWLNPYGSQSSRFQPKAGGFIPLKSAWMRSLIQPKPGRAIAAIDYGSQEFLVAALLSADKNMFESYASGDPYFYFAKLAKAVPMDAKRSDHEDIRTLFKSTVLGISYLMGSKALAAKLTADTGKFHDENDSARMTEIFFNTFSRYNDFIERTIYDYREKGYLKLADGWIMFGDNPNHRSISNCPVQGMGAVILRKAIELSQIAGLTVLYPLHDALYIEYSVSQETEAPRILSECMREAFVHYFKDTEVEDWSAQIRMDGNIWGPDIKEDYRKIGDVGFKMQTIYVDERARLEYERFKIYFSN